MRIVESWVLSYLLNSLWQIPLLFAVGWLTVRALRGVGTAAEHRVWVTVMLLQSLLPACSALSWEWLRAHLAWGGGAMRAGDAHVSVTMGAGAALSSLNPPQLVLSAIFLAYVAATVFFMARFVLRWRQLRVLRREAVDVELTKNAAACWSRCAQKFAIRGASIAASSGIFGPITIGFSRKLVLLPLSMVSGESEEDLQTVIAHEFAHIGRNDYAKNFIYELLTLPASYHPIFWLTRERVMESREILCDQIASEIGGPTQYGRSLLRLAALLIEGQSTRTPHAIGIFDANTFERRVMMLTRKRNEIRGVRRLAIVAACAVFGMGTCGVSLAMSMHVDLAAAAGDNGAPAKTPGMIHVSARTMESNVLFKIPPKYPVGAKKARIQGTVVLNAEIGRNGRVKNLTVASGPKELRKSSLDAVRQWRYKPFLLNGSPVKVLTTVTVIYSLRP